MDQIQFALGGKTLQLHRRQVIEKLRPLKPEAIQTWAVEVEGRRFPVKQALSHLTGVGRADFISHRARDLFQRLGFTVVNIDRPPEAKAAPANVGDAAPNPPAPQRPGEPDRTRLQALQLAMAYMTDRAQASPDAVLEAAAKFEAWLRGNAQTPPPRV